MKTKTQHIETSDEPGRKIGYARCSTKEQKLDLQLNALKEAGCDIVFEEKMSGTIDDRPEFAKAIAELRANDVLIVWKLDRMGRSTRHLLDIIELIKEKGASFRSLTEGLDGGGAMGKMIFGIFAILAEYERELSHERIMAGIEAFKDAGGKLGHRRGTCHATTPEDDKDIEMWINAGVPYRQIALKLGVSYITIARRKRLMKDKTVHIYTDKKIKTTYEEKT